MPEIFDLSEEKMKTINALHREEGKRKSLYDFVGGLKEPGKLWGWTFEDPGWDAE